MTNVGSPRGTVNIGSDVALVTACTTTFSSDAGLCLIHPSTASKPMTIGTNSNNALITNNLTLTSSGDINVGATSSLNLTAGTGDINILSTGLITIGNSGAITMGATQTASNYVNIGSSTTVGATGLRLFQPITCINGSNWATPATNQVGGIKFGTLSGSTSGPFAATRGTLTLGTGVHIINANMRYDSTIAYAIMSISQTNNAIQNICAISGGTTSGTTALNLTRHISIAAGASITFYLVTQSFTSNISSVVFLATKIA
jgi:hypothetical protein